MVLSIQQQQQQKKTYYKYTFNEASEAIVL